MSSTDQYGRKTWDVDEYAAKAGKKEEQKPNVALKNSSVLQQRAHLIDLAVLAVGTHTLVSSSTTATHGRNKRFGFFCPLCDLSFRDTLALVDHFNSLQHARNVLKAAGGTAGGELENGVRRASAKEVSDMLEQLVRALVKARAASSGAASLHERVAKRQQFEQARAKRRQAKRERKVEAEPETDIGLAMGFEGFGTTKR